MSANKARKVGYNTNLASEFYVLSVLYRLGLDANLTLGNKKAVDIVVVRAAGDVITIDVKAVAGKMDWLAGRPADTPKANHFIALLSFEGRIGDPVVLPSVWIMPHAEFLARIGIPKSQSELRYISRKRVLAECGAFKDAWGLLAGE